MTRLKRANMSGQNQLVPSSEEPETLLQPTTFYSCPIWTGCKAARFDGSTLMQSVTNMQFLVWVQWPSMLLSCVKYLSVHVCFKIL